MKKIYAILMMALMVMTTSAATADWYLYTWSDTQNAGGEAGQFQTTGTDGVFLLEGCNIGEEGVKFCIHNAAWSEMYGWSDDEGGGSVETTDKAVKLASATGANGWIALPTGNYDVTWNANDKTITFLSATSTSVNADWYIYYWDDAANAGDDLGQFKTTDTDGVFLLENVELTSDDGVKFCIHNSAWSSTYGWGWTEGSEGGSVTETGKDVLLETSSSASAWLGLPAGKYNVTWNATALTVRFESVTSTGIRVAKRFNGDNGISHNLSGQRVGSNHKGILIVNGKKVIRK